MESKEAAANAKRRRGLGIVTPNACTECRKKRAKCDGDTPCGRCRSTTSDCVYEVPVRQSKETMRLEIESLRHQQQQNQRIFAALVSTDKSNEIIEQLRSGETIDNISDGLENNSRSERHGSGSSSNMMTSIPQTSARQAIGIALKPALDVVASVWPFNTEDQGRTSKEAVHNQPNFWNSGEESSSRGIDGGVTQDDVMNWDPDTSPETRPEPSFPLVGTWHRRSISASTPDSTTTRARSKGQETILGSTFGLEVRSDSYHPNFNQSWTSVTNDGAFVEHLMALYFCWEYPTFASLSKEHFLDDFRHGKSRRCSPLLVNALLALGCRFSDQPNARTDPNDSATAGDHFFKEAVRLLGIQEDHHILTTVQAMGLMSIREASCGRSSESIYYSGQSISLALEMGLHRNDEFDANDDEDETEHAVRAATFWGAFSLDQALSLSIGRLPHFSKNLSVITKPQIVDHIEASSWIPYTDDGAPLETSCTQPSNVRSVYKTFCELSEFVHKSLYTLYAPGNTVTSQALLSCYHEYLQWYDAIPSALRLGHNFTPAVLFAHMYYHFAILLLFRPFIKLEIVGSQVSPRDVCGQAADAISSLVKSYSRLYTLKRTPSFVPYFVLTSTIAHVIAYGNSRGGVENLRQGIADLKEMTSCHRFAGRALNILYFLIDRWKINMKFEEHEEGFDYTKLCQPISTSSNLFCPNFSTEDLMDGIGPAKPSSNPLFWPFPLQGRPVLDIQSLDTAGFKVLTF